MSSASSQVAVMHGLVLQMTPTIIPNMHGQLTTALELQANVWDMHLDILFLVETTS